MQKGGAQGGPKSGPSGLLEALGMGLIERRLAWNAQGPELGWIKVEKRRCFVVV
jgi:hypothetical protein